MRFVQIYLEISTNVLIHYNNWWFSENFQIVVGEKQNRIFSKTFKVPLEYSFWFTSFSISTITEEICFRGLLFFLLSGLNKKFVVFITSILFSSIHFLGWYIYSSHLTLESFIINAISIFILGCVLGWIYLKTHSIWATSFLHSINNLLAVGFV